MKLNEREQYIFSSGIWFGVGALIIALCVSIALMRQPESTSWMYGILFGVVFILFGIYSINQAENHEPKPT